ncbi:MAG TPA: nucleotide sugar dehydrogenase [Candidatus Krumholzibacteria bacterium]|nr:nucleotide sugar dehydrogenase [Candidatus Krumholzibacteria bacterium]
MSLIERIRARDAKVAVIGLGYVGLPLAVELARAGYHAVGIDVVDEKVRRVNQGDSYIKDVPSDLLAECVKSGHLVATSDFSVLKSCDTVNICVPTPLRKTRDPDISYIVSAVEEIAKYIHQDMLVVLESTTYPGTTEEVILPMLERDDFKVGRDFFVAFSPERVDPGNPRFNTKNIPKVVGGITPACTEVACELYRSSLTTVVPVSSAKVAETVKLLENTFRSVNIGLVNEIALMCNKMDIDVWEVIRAASTKPFGFMPFFPGPGLGGHCIPIDPFYLSWKAKLAGFEARFIELAGQINGSMPEYVVGRVAEALNRRKKAVNGARVLVVGVSYKANIDDIRESPALDVMRLLKRHGADVLYHDRYANAEDPELAHAEVESVELTPQELARFDCAVIVTGHDGVDYQQLLANVPVVVDTRNVYAGVNSDKIVRL